MENDLLNILIASDSFKGSASTLEVANYLSNGINRVASNALIDILPIADGGEGTVDALVYGADGIYKFAEVTGPYGAKVRAKYGIINDTAVVEVAETSGLTLVNSSELNPYIATSYGLGELLKKIISDGFRHILIGLGGSATNDGGVGMAQALGAKFLDSDGQQVRLGAVGLKDIATIDVSDMTSLLSGVKLEVLSDVLNPFIGPEGASFIFGKQKGAVEEDLTILDSYLEHYQMKVKSEMNIDFSILKGAGAAGGLGATLWGLCNASLTSGIDVVLDMLNIDKRLEKADVVITGEGKLDAQSIYGKAIMGVAKCAKRHNVPVIAVVGSSDEDLSVVYQNSIDLVITIVNRPMSLLEAMSNVSVLIENAGETAIRSLLISRKYYDKKIKNLIKE